MKYIAWFLLLVMQNASFTWVSRARNSGSYGYHAIAAVFSNGIFFASNLILIGVGLQGLQNAEWNYVIRMGTLYITATVIGSVAMHYVSMNYLETGKRKIGATDKPVVYMADSYKSGHQPPK